MAAKRVAQPGPFAAFEWLLAFRYLRSRKRKRMVSIFAGFSFAGIMLGVATLITVMSVMNGFRKELFEKLGGASGHLSVAPIARPFTDYAEMADKISKVPGVARAVPIIRGQVFATSDNGGVGAIVQGARKADLIKMDALKPRATPAPPKPGEAALSPEQERARMLEKFGTEEGVAIGSGLAAQLGLYEGDAIKLTNPKGESTPFGIAPRIKDYPIVAIFKIGMSKIDEVTILMPLEEAQKYFDMEGRAQEVEIFLKNPDDIDVVKQDIMKAVGEEVSIGDWRYANQAFFSAIAVERNVMFLILTLIILVAALNIVSGLTMLVKDKSSDIAILRTMGATSAAVMRVFMIAGAAIGATGTVAGFGLGLLLTLNVERIRQFFSWLTRSEIFPEELYFLSQLPAEIDVREVVTILVLAFTLSLLATIYPAYRAARLDPVQALRYG